MARCRRCVAQSTSTLAAAAAWLPLLLQRKATSVQLSLPDPPAKWATLAVDLHQALATHSPTAQFECLRGVQLCAKLCVRGVFTSDIKFGAGSLPSEMVLSHLLAPGDTAWVWLPSEPQDLPEPQLAR